MKSQWAVVAYKRYGGLTWLYILIAWGSVPKEAVDLYNDRILKKIAEGRRAEVLVGDYVTADPPTDRALAASQGNPPPRPRGIQHTTSEPNALRERAK